MQSIGACPSMEPSKRKGLLDEIEDLEAKRKQKADGKGKKKAKKDDDLDLDLW